MHLRQKYNPPTTGSQHIRIPHLLHPTVSTVATFTLLLMQQIQPCRKDMIPTAINIPLAGPHVTVLHRLHLAASIASYS